MTRGKSLSFAWPESFVQRYWIDGTKIGNLFDLTTHEPFRSCSCCDEDGGSVWHDGVEDGSLFVKGRIHECFSHA